MRIQGPHNKAERAKNVSAELRLLWDEIGGGRVCGPHCQLTCAVCRQTDCRCQCGRDCPSIAEKLSSEGDCYPLEDRVAPLVFELKRLGAFEPCWSCEGHLDKSGKPWKGPQVWFYSENVTAVRILADVLAALAAARTTGALWEVALTHSDPDNPAPMFALRPQAATERTVPLAVLQDDLGAIAANLHTTFQGAAKEMEISLASRA